VKKKKGKRGRLDKGGRRKGDPENPFQNNFVEEKHQRKERYEEGVWTRDKKSGEEGRTLGVHRSKRPRCRQRLVTCTD